MCFDNTCNLKQVVNLILCWFGMFSPLPFSFLFDFWSHCLAVGTARRQFSPESKLVLHHELFSLTQCFLQHPVLFQPQSLSLPFHISQSPFNPLPFTSPLFQYGRQQAGTLAPDWICCIFKFQVTGPPSSWSASEYNHMRQAVSTQNNFR